MSLLDPSSLVQLLAVYEDDTTGSEEITYGDATAILQDGDNLLEVVVNRVGSTTRFGEITGRLLSAPGEGPTGTLVMSYDPGSGNQLWISKKFPYTMGGLVFCSRW